MKKITIISILIFYFIGNSTNANSNEEWYKPKIGDNMLIQLQGNVNTDLNVNIYDIDLFDTPQKTIDKIHSKGKRVICYFSAGTYEDWRKDKNKFLKKIIGKKLNNWPGEKWLDISNYKLFDEIMISRLNLAVFKKCDGVDFDNISYSSNSISKKGFNITYNDYIKYNTFLAKQAHKRGLSVGLKNNLLQIKDLVNIFDFEINEECYTYNECNYLKPFIQNNKPVFGIEYELKKDDFCPKAKKDGYSFILENYDLDGTKTNFCNKTIIKNNKKLVMYQKDLDIKLRTKVNNILNNLKTKHSKEYNKKLYNKLIIKLETLKLNNTKFINNIRYSLLIDYIIIQIKDKLD